jgi:hypothetical protein
MIIEVAEDPMMDKFQAGDVVRFSLEEKDVYSYDVPKTGTIGVIEIQTHNFAIEQMLGVKIPMSVVQWSDGRKIPVFSHDLTKVSASKERIEAISDKLKKLTAHTATTYN